MTSNAKHTLTLTHILYTHQIYRLNEIASIQIYSTEMPIIYFLSYPFIHGVCIDTLAYIFFFLNKRAPYLYYVEKVLCNRTQFRFCLMCAFFLSFILRHVATFFNVRFHFSGGIHFEWRSRRENASFIFNDLHSSFEHFAHLGFENGVSQVQMNRQVAIRRKIRSHFAFFLLNSISLSKILFLCCCFFFVCWKNDIPNPSVGFERLND